jgi:hypothetical protein
MGSHHSDRRQFLTESAALAGLARGSRDHLIKCLDQGIDGGHIGRVSGDGSDLHPRPRLRKCRSSND